MITTISWSLAKCACPSWSSLTDESALRRILANLDDSGLSLHWWLGFWTFLVALGVVLEVVFVVWEYWEEMHDFRRGIIHAPERPNTALFALGLLGAGLVAAGVSGELWKESQIAKLETCIRKGNDALFLLLSKEAGNAAKSAKDAHDLGTDLLEKYKTAEQEITDLKAAKMPRRLSSDQKNIFRAAVTSFKGRTFNISCAIPGGDAKEPLDFELDFVDAINRKTPLQFQYLTNCDTFIGGVFIPPTQVEAGVDRQGDADILVKALVEIGIAKKNIVRKRNDNKAILALTIGPKAI